MPFNNGENVGPYRVTEQLGRGGMATVYKAYHAKLDRYVALKVLHPAFLEDENFLARFQREARLVAKLEHPNIVPIYDFAEHDGQPYLVMKFVEGETLKALINRGRLSVEQIWKVVEAVGSGLGYAHQQGILHRDIKPSNVIVADDGQIYLADFGLARIAEMGESTLSGDMIMGTPQYISPEQAMGVKDLDARTDIYSFAVVLYEMVVGQVPFSADTPFSIIHDHIYSPLPLPKTVNPSVPEGVERVLLKALAKERDDRYQSIPELVQAFKDAWEESDVDMAEVTMTKPITEVATKVAAAGIAATAPDPAPATAVPVAAPSPTDTADPASTGASLPVKKKKRPVWVLVIAGLVLVAAAFAAIFFYHQANQAPPTIAEAREWAKSEPNEPYAQLALSQAFLAEKQFKPAYESLRRGLDLAGDDTEFHYAAGADMMDQEAWAGAALVFSHALKIVPPEQMDDRRAFEDLFRESLYKAALTPELFEILPPEEIARIDEPMARLANVRLTFYHGNRDDAWQMLEDLKADKPDMPEGTLLEAEMNMREGNREQATQLFESLLNDDSTPPWILEIATDKLDNMP